LVEAHIVYFTYKTRDLKETPLKATRADIAWIIEDRHFARCRRNDLAPQGAHVHEMLLVDVQVDVPHLHPQMTCFVAATARARYAGARFREVPRNRYGAGRREREEHCDCYPSPRPRARGATESFHRADSEGCDPQRVTEGRRFSPARYRVCLRLRTANTELQCNLRAGASGLDAHRSLRRNALILRPAAESAINVARRRARVSGRLALVTQ